jgi:hypothetical protein
VQVSAPCAAQEAVRGEGGAREDAARRRASGKCSPLSATAGSDSLLAP